MPTLSARDFIKKKNAEWTAELGREGKRGFKDISRKGKHYFMREAWTLMPQHNISEKVFVFERLRRVDIIGTQTHERVKVGDIEYRFGYYIVGRIGNRKGRWTWGQYCPLIPGKDLTKLLAKAKKDGTIL